MNRLRSCADGLPATVLAHQCSCSGDIGSMACTSWDNETGKSSKENVGDIWELVATSKQSGDEYHFKKDTVRKRSYNGSPAISTLWPESMM
jgi:hypothetical protein